MKKVRPLPRKVRKIQNEFSVSVGIPERSEIEIASSSGEPQGAAAQLEVDVAGGSFGDAVSSLPGTPKDLIHFAGGMFIYREPLRRGTRIYKGIMRSEIFDEPIAVKFNTIDATRRETSIMLKLRPHSNVVAILHSDVWGSLHQSYIAMELCSLQNLQDYLDETKEKNIPLNLNLTMRFSQHLISGMRHIHHNGIIHRALMPSNILFSQDKTTLKIVNFGQSIKLPYGHTVTHISSPGQMPSGFRAPESYYPNEISKQADIFPLGIIMHGLWSNGKHPFGSDPLLLDYNIVNDRGRDRSGILISGTKGEELCDLIDQTLQPNPSKRPTIDEVAQHPFMRSAPIPTKGEELDRENAAVLQLQESYHERAREIGAKDSALLTQDHPLLTDVKGSKGKESSQVKTPQGHGSEMTTSQERTEMPEDPDCTICEDRKPNETLPCGHNLCSRCLAELMQRIRCPYCRGEHVYSPSSVEQLLKKVVAEKLSKDTLTQHPDLTWPMSVVHQTGSQHPATSQSEITNVSTGEPQVDQQNLELLRDSEISTNPDVEKTSTIQSKAESSSNAEESEITKTSTGESQVDEQNPELLPSLELPANPDMQGTSTTEQTGECSTSADDKQTSEDKEFDADDHSEYQEDNCRKNEPPMKHVIDRTVNSCKKNKVFTLSHQKFCEADIQYLVKSLQEIPKDIRIRIIGLRNCSVDKKFLQELQKCGREVNEIDFSANQELDVPNLIKFLKGAKPKSLDLSDCNLDRDKMEKLAEVQVESLKLNYKAFVDDSAAAPLAQSLSRGLKTLELVDSSISTEDLKIFAKGPPILLQCLDLAHVPLDEDDMAAVAGIVNRTNEMKRLGLSKCYITTEGLKEFHDNVSKKVRELDVSYNEEIDEAGDRLLGQIVTKCETAILDISGWLLDKDNIVELRKHVKCTVLEVSLSENPGIDTSEVGKMVVKWNVQTLNLSECRLEAQDLFDLCDSMESHELKLLDVSDPTDAVSKHKRSALQALSKKVKTLEFGDHQTWT